ncbi:MAG: hypothetical protein RLZZ24_106 [Pseudomonadota bacterium]
MQLFEYIVHRFDQLGPLANQRMTTVRLRRVNRTGHRHHLTAHVERQLRGDERARMQCRFDHQGAQSQCGDQTVATRKMRGQRRCAQRVFAQQQTLLCNALRQRLVLTRIHPIQTRADHGHRQTRVTRCGAGARCTQRAHMGRTIDPQCQARDDAQASLGQSL